MILRRRLDLDLADVRPELKIVRNAAWELRNSVKFKKVLQVSYHYAFRISSFSGVWAEGRVFAFHSSSYLLLVML